jgi:hypothetical protein
MDTGNWSEPVVYHVAVTTDSDSDGLLDSWELTYSLDPLSTNGINGAHGDADGDGMDNLSEYIADTNPRDDQSLLEITGIRILPEGIRLDWKGGEWATQYIQASANLNSTSEVWSSIHTNGVLPTLVTNFVIDAAATNRTLFYRIKAER